MNSMSECKTSTSKDYDESYYNNCCGQKNYITGDWAINFFHELALNIKERFRPKTVLDAGCACGHLVAALRDLGIEAYGVDISEFAISNVREDIKPYCVVASLVDRLPSSFPVTYDLVTNIEILEHIEENESLKSLDLLCKYSTRVLFSSSPDDIIEPTHVNVQPIEYWVEHFTKNGFYPNLEINCDFLTAYALVFDKSTEFISLFRSFTTSWWKEKKLRLTGEQKQYDLASQNQQLTSQNQQLTTELSDIHNSRVYNVVQKYYKLRDKLFPVGSLRRKIVKKITNLLS